MKKNPYIAPVVISLFVILYFIGYGWAVATFEMPILTKCIFIIIPVVLITGMVFTLKERIKEIKKGENDDLGKY